MDRPSCMCPHIACKEFALLRPRHEKQVGRRNCRPVQEFLLCMALPRLRLLASAFIATVASDLLHLPAATKGREADEPQGAEHARHLVVRRDGNSAHQAARLRLLLDADGAGYDPQRTAIEAQGLLALKMPRRTLGWVLVMLSLMQKLLDREVNERKAGSPHRSNTKGSRSKEAECNPLKGNQRRHGDAHATGAQKE